LLMLGALAWLMYRMATRQPVPAATAS
jgi:hypothetical protein